MKEYALWSMMVLTGVSALYGQSTQAGYALLPPKATAHANVATPMVSGTMKLRPYNHVSIRGAFDVELIGNTNRHDIRYIGNEDDISNIDVQVIGDTLTVKMNTPKLYKDREKRRTLVIIRGDNIEDLFYAGSGKFNAIGLNAPYVDVTLHNRGPVELHSPKLHLHRLSVGGSGPVTIGRLDAPNLSIDLKGSNAVNLYGQASLHKLVINGKGSLSLDKLISPHLRVIAHNSADIRLGGQVDVLEMMLYNNSFFDGKDLLVRKAFVKTYDASRADIQVTELQNTLASDHSNIFYYRTPVQHEDFMHHSGSVLQLANFADE